MEQGNSGLGDFLRVPGVAPTRQHICWTRVETGSGSPLTCLPWRLENHKQSWYVGPGREVFATPSLSRDLRNSLQLSLGPGKWRAPRDSDLERAAPFQTQLTHRLPTSLPQLTFSPAPAVPRPCLSPSGPHVRARALKLCPGSARGARPEVRRLCSRRRRRRREVRLSPVGRAAPRSAAAIAGQAAGGGHGRPREATPESWRGEKGRESGKLESWGRAGHAAPGEEWRAEGRGTAGRGRGGGQGDGSREGRAEVGAKTQGLP